MTMLLLAAALLSASGGEAAPGNEGRLRVLKQQDVLWIRSPFSPDKDLVLLMGKGDNRQVNFDKVFIAPRTAGIRPADVYNLIGSVQVSQNTDDSTPWHLNGTYIGANHGCSDARSLVSPKHGLSVRDLGSTWTDEAGTKFVLLRIPDADHVWVLSADPGPGPVWRFVGEVRGKILKRSADGATLPITSVEGAQLRPACRISRQQVLVDGTTPLSDDSPVECSSLEVVEDFDILSPASVVKDVLAHPGQERDFAGPELQAVVSNRIVYRFLPSGAVVIHHSAEAKQAFDLGYVGFIQAGVLTPRPAMEVHDFYIPKTSPFEQDGVRWDFESIQDYRRAPSQPLQFSPARQNVANPADLPDRFVHLLGRREGNRTTYDVGFAFGYSLIRGMTVPEVRSRNTGTAVTLYTSAKTYPRAADGKMNGGQVPRRRRPAATGIPRARRRCSISPITRPSRGTSSGFPKGSSAGRSGSSRRRRRSRFMTIGSSPSRDSGSARPERMPRWWSPSNERRVEDVQPNRAVVAGAPRRHRLGTGSEECRSRVLRQHDRQ